MGSVHEAQGDANRRYMEEMGHKIAEMDRPFEVSLLGLDPGIDDLEGSRRDIAAAFIRTVTPKIVDVPTDLTGEFSRTMINPGFNIHVDVAERVMREREESAHSAGYQAALDDIQKLGSTNG